MKKDILITGGNGLIAYELIKILTKEFNVFCLTSSKVDSENNNFKIIKVDFNEPWNTNILPKKIDIIYHLSQSANFRKFPKKSIEIFNVNTFSTLKLLEYARIANCQKFIFASSGGLYGIGDFSFNENNSINPKINNNFYLTSKFCSELLVDNYKQFFNVFIIRFFFVYGKRQAKDMLIPRLIDNIICEKKIVLNGKEGIKINPIYVDDVVNALKKIIVLKDSETINIGGNEVFSIREICDIIGDELSIKPQFQINGSETLNLIGNVEKMNMLLNQPKFSFRNGVKKLLNEKK